MGRISLRKLLYKKDVAPVLHGIINAIGSSVTIEDAGGAVLLTANDDAAKTSRSPVTVSGDIIGWVIGDGKTAPIASMIAYLAGMESERRNLADETLNKYKEINLLYNMAEKVSSCLDPGEVAKLVIDETKKFIDGSGTSLKLLNEETGELETITSCGNECNAHTTAAPDKGIEGSIFTTGKAEIVNDVLADPRYVAGENKVSSMICAPLKIKDKVIGTIKISSENPINYTAEHLKLLNTIASQAAAAIENARLYDELKEAFFTTVYTLAETIEKRDPYTGGHTKRVMEYSLAIGRVLALSEEDMTRLKLSAILHDIGKIGVKDSVLLKAGKLTDEEFDEIKRHAVYGEEILAHIKQLKNIIPGVKYHHEKYNGKGYPDGLKEEEIDITARIIAVADSFDAMTSSRPYREGLSLDIAFEELRKHAGTQFDPDVVTAFFAADVIEAFFEANARGKFFS